MLLPVTSFGDHEEDDMYDDDSHATRTKATTTANGRRLVTRLDGRGVIVESFKDNRLNQGLPSPGFLIFVASGSQSSNSCL